MAISDISLTAGMRNNLLGLQQTARQVSLTQERLGSGKKVNTALDNPTNFFAAQAANNRASDLADRKDSMSEAVQTIKGADNGISAITALIQSAKGLASAAQSTNDTLSQATYESQFVAIKTQITTLASDAGYRGTNLLTDGTLSIEFSQKTGDANLTVNGFKADAASLGVTSAANWAVVGNVTQALSNMDGALSVLRTKSSTLASNLSVITTRQDFTANMINTLQQGADGLTLADMNTEGANMLMLQTRQSLGTTALSMSSQAAQSVLRLF
ncbi:flagellin [Pelotalea chapellei]|uniref:Flagellin n=1 Tax=Pelotalea chapellei TaxID=44671 RepID=A0ABS5UAP1_9BACT|nr:flagellin [Pelotalea chapellei]MBT1072715.1 flagellin [Pelotalea chapellei]